MFDELGVDLGNLARSFEGVNINQVVTSTTVHYTLGEGPEGIGELKFTFHTLNTSTGEKEEHSVPVQKVVKEDGTERFMSVKGLVDSLHYAAHPPQVT